jgi:integrase
VSRRGYSTREDAEDALRRFIATRPRYREEHQEPEKITVREFLERWIASKECANASQPIEPTTAEGYRKSALNISHYVGEKHVHELTAGHLKAAWDRLRKEGGPRGRPLGKKTVGNAAKMMRTALRDAIAEGLVTRNVALDAKPSKVVLEQVKDEKFWSQDDLRTFLADSSDDPFYIAWLLAGTTGMRRGEVLGATWNKCNLDTGELAVVMTRTTVDGKSFTNGVKTLASR